MERDDDKRVNNLKKIVLSLEAGTRPGASDLTSEPVSWGFVFGIGSEGLAGFEYALADKQEGESVEITLDRETLRGMLGHLRIPLPLEGIDEGPVYLKVGIERVEAADQREVIRAMADASGCGDHCCGH